MKLPYAKALRSWEVYYGTSLRALQQGTTLATQLGFVLSNRQDGAEQNLPKGWLMWPLESRQSLNSKSIAETVEAETGGRNEYVYISPKGCRFPSLKAALAYAKKQRLVEALPQDLASAPSVTTTTVEFTSNHED